MLSRTAALSQIWETLNTYLKLALRKSVMEAKPIVPPEHVRGMKVLDKKAFDTVILVPYMEIPQIQLRNVAKTLKPYMLKMRGLQPIQAMPDSTEKTILLNPEMVTSVADFEPVVQTKLKQSGLIETDIKEKVVAIGYDNFKAHTLLRAILPENLPIVAGFSTVGHVLHLNLREYHFEYKNVIGQILLDTNVNVRTVINKVNAIDSTYRNFQMELLAGENDMVVKVKEYGCTFEFDYSTVYWNSRLSEEHTRIVKKFQPGHILFDVFAGVGPFAIPVAKMGKIKNRQTSHGKGTSNTTKLSKKNANLAFQKKSKKAKPVITSLKKMNLKNKDVIESLDQKMDLLHQSGPRPSSKQPKAKKTELPVKMDDTIEEIKTLNF